MFKELDKRKVNEVENSILEEWKKQDILNKDNIEVIYNSNVVKLIGNDILEQVEIEDNNKERKTLDLQGLFIAIGQIPENENFRKVIDLDSNGYAISQEDCKTKTEGIFVAGDNRQKELRQLVTAASDGAIAATQAIKYLKQM